ncbi:Dbl homology domain-containing protein, partial [Fistulina hepatica ATCC 64428]
WDSDPEQFINFSLLSHLSVLLRDKVPRGTHVKGSIPYPRAFTGKDIVSTIQSQIQNACFGVGDRRLALQVARSLQNQLFFYEVEWGSRELRDGVEDVYMFLDDAEDTRIEREELPNGVVTLLTKCYAPDCSDEARCYSYSCPRKGITAGLKEEAAAAEVVEKEWQDTVSPALLASLSPKEIRRQTIIFKLIAREEAYLRDLDTVESVFIRPLLNASPPVVENPAEFVEAIFSNISELRGCNHRLLEVLCVRQREHAPLIRMTGDIFLEAATEFRFVYPVYMGNHSMAEKRLKDELDTNSKFRLFIEQRSRQYTRDGDGPRLDLRHFLNRPVEHLQRYPFLLEALYHETESNNADGDFLMEALQSIRKLQSMAQLRTFQLAMGLGPSAKWEWHDLVTPDIRRLLTKEECKRQAIIFELIKTEMAYVRDLELLTTLYMHPLCNAEPAIIPSDRLQQFTVDVFHNHTELYFHHRKFLDKLHEIQREEHPRIYSITAVVFDAVLNFREAYLEYVPNYPIAHYRIDEEIAKNAAFAAFIEQCLRHPDSQRLHMKHFISRPIPRLQRYELLLKGILEQTPASHPDRQDIPQVIELLSALCKETEPGVTSAKQKVELWQYNSKLIFKAGESVNMDLLNENRSLIYTGKLLRQPDNSGLRGNDWQELFVLVFDNYFVMTRQKDKDDATKYHVYRRPIPLDLMTLVNFTDPPTQRGAGLLRNLRGARDGSVRDLDTSLGTGNGLRTTDTTDSRSLYPFTLHHNGRLGGTVILYAESAQARTEWKQKLEEALGLRNIVQESNKVFEVELLSTETFLVPSMSSMNTTPAWGHEGSITGKVTCSVPFNTPDGRGLVAIGCEEGVWIGYRHDSRSLRRVLHVKMVTQCAMLEDFGLFLVCADKALFAYHIEALVPSTLHSSQTMQTPQKLNGSREVAFFSVGAINGRTLVIYVKKKGVTASNFYVLEPVIDKINEKAKTTTGGLGSRLFRAPRSDWFRSYREFILPSEAFDIVFLKARIAILCAKGFEIMDLAEYLKSVSIPVKEDSRLAALSKRLDSCRPLGMFRSTDDEFLLCYDGKQFGVYVDKHGEPSRNGVTVEWEGTAEHVAFHPPYILLFDTRFIEIRRVETGLLTQIIPGNDVRCIWDGRGLNSNYFPTLGDGQDAIIQEARVHGAMNAPEPPPVPGLRSSKPSVQHVFELIPTIPLYLPGSLASPSNMMMYYPQSSSPPHSPTLQPVR